MASNLWTPIPLVNNAPDGKGNGLSKLGNQGPYVQYAKFPVPVELESFMTKVHIPTYDISDNFKFVPLKKNMLTSVSFTMRQNRREEKERERLYGKRDT